MSTNLDRSVVVPLAIIATVTLFYVLAVGRQILVPLALAVLIWYVLNALSRLYASLLPERLRIDFLTLLAAFVTIWVVASFIFDLIQNNISQVVAAAPGYRIRIERIIDKISHTFHFEQSPSLKQLIGTLEFGPLMSQLASALTATLGNIGLVMIYVIFLLLEQNTFGRKMFALFPDEKRQEAVKAMFTRMNDEIQTYLGIKTLVSLVTGLLSYLVLRMVGVDYAEFWGVMIFMFNFIPTIGSIVATMFPALLTLIQFDTWTPFIVVVAALTTIQFLLGNLLEPRMMGKTLNLSPMVVLLSLALWGGIWGIPGMFLAVPITVIALIVLSHFPATRPIAILLSSSGEIKATD